jgi:pimeloyl-ACP methyl ester carboxylesterase
MPRFAFLIATIPSLLAATGCGTAPERAPAVAPAACAGTAAISFLGSDTHPMYVEDWPACNASVRHAKPQVVLVHGCCHSSLYWSVTPDGREGFATLFRRAGFPVTLVELPGHGRAPAAADFANTGLEPARIALAELLARDQRVVLIGHSMGGQVIYRALAGLDAVRRARIAGVLLLAPVRPPELIEEAESQLPSEGVIRFPPELARGLFASTPTFPAKAFAQYYRSLVPESAVATQEFSAPRGLAPVGAELLRGIPAALIYGERDFIPSARFEQSARYFAIPLFRLGADWGLADHGHMFMIERGNEAIARRLTDWIETNAR